MTRLTLTLAAWISVLAVGSASWTPRKASPTLGSEFPQVRAAQLSTRALQEAAGWETKSEYVVTERTEVLLNGKPCKYEAVPSHASIVRIQLAVDMKTVLRIHFQTRK